MEKKSKLVLAVLQGSDSDNTIRNLNERGFMVTVLSSTGGFLKKKSTTVMIGVEEEKLEGLEQGKSFHIQGGALV